MNIPKYICIKTLYLQVIFLLLTGFFSTHLFYFNCFYLYNIIYLVFESCFYRKYKYIILVVIGYTNNSQMYNINLCKLFNTVNND